MKITLKEFRNIIKETIDQEKKKVNEEEMNLKKWETILTNDIAKKFNIKGNILIYPTKQMDIIPDKKGSDNVTFEAWTNRKKILTGIASIKTGKLLAVKEKPLDLKMNEEKSIAYELGYKDYKNSATKKDNRYKNDKTKIQQWLDGWIQGEKDDRDSEVQNGKIAKNISEKKKPFSKKDISQYKLNEQVKYPDIEVQLTGNDGNAFSILGNVQKAMRKGGASPEDIKKFMEEATKGDYNNLLATCMKWVTVNESLIKRKK